MSKHLREPDLTELEAAAKIALVDAEHLLDVLGLEATSGAELEFYINGLTKSPLSHDQATEQIKTLVRRNPYAFKYSAFTGMTISEMTLFEGETVEGVTIGRVDYSVSRNQCCFTEPALGVMLAQASLEFSAQGIDLFAFHPESGQLLEAAGERYRTAAKQYEISTLVASPTQTANQVNQINMILESAAQATGVSFAPESLPPFAYEIFDNGSVSLRVPPNSRHLHYGALYKDGTNAFADAENKPTVFSRAANKSVIDLLLGGSLRLANSKHNDLMRLKHRAGSVPFQLNTGCNQSAIVEKDYLADVKPHKEFRMSGAGTPPHIALLVPVLGMVDAALALIGKEARPKTFLGNILTRSHKQDLKTIAAGITAEDVAKLRERASRKVDSAAYGSGKIVDDLLRAHRADTSKLQAYVPQVASALSKISAFRG